ncbi:hypothetical protein HMPREF0372_02231 [Flavonifractor plautii ATCC 29863]|uniref:Uncharacterized protein n=1 Tax=Flavonifractor plautii ATCC 29863 TaxID=411475 RepID=G9YRT0_FLAPL|nr:hypothetical protein HMPREF0372_02231 [Flavonifractor plautii ATCC 29863]
MRSQRTEHEKAAPGAAYTKGGKSDLDPTEESKPRPYCTILGAGGQGGLYGDN